MVKKEKLLCFACAFLVAAALTGCQKEPLPPLASPPDETVQAESGSSAPVDKTQDALPTQSSSEALAQQPEIEQSAPPAQPPSGKPVQRPEPEQESTTLQPSPEKQDQPADTSEPPSGQILLPENTENSPDDEVKPMLTMEVSVGETKFTATLENNAAVEAFVEMMQAGPVVIQMNDYAGFEKVGSLGTSLPTSNSQTTAQPGDIVLYNGNQIVVFYGTNSWSYTRLGHINDLTGWEDALGSGDVTITFSIGE